MPVAIRPRRIGLVITAIILFALAGFTRVGWLLLFDAVLWGAVLVSAVMPWLAIGNLRVRRRVSNWQGRGEYSEPMEGDEVELEIVLENRGLLPCMFVNLTYSYDGQPIESDKQRLFVAWLGRNASYMSTTSVKFTRRGLHSLPQIRVETSVPFGMFRRTRTVEQPTEVLVLPKVYPLERLELLDNTGSNSPYSLRARVGEQVAGSRGYVSGDPWHHIHWRNTARMGQPQVKEFEKTPENALTIAFNTSRLGQDGDKALEDAVRIAASAGDYACGSVGIVRLIAGSLNDEASDRHHLLRSLALLKGSRDMRLPELAALVPPLSAAIVIVKDTDSGGIKEISRLAAGQRRVTVVLLRGFDQTNTPSNPAGELLKSGASVVECWPGEAARAVAMLGKALRIRANRQGRV